jgi:ubiquinone/menaquinone biosynthesis C-methylase UbiE
MGYQVVLTDISRGMLERARTKLSELKFDKRVEIRISDVCSMPEFEDDQFAMVICEGDALSYCGDHHAATREFARVVRSGGTVVASVDNRASAVNWLRGKGDLEALEQLLETGDVIMPLECEEFSYVVHTFTAEELRELFESYGLLVQRIIGKLVVAGRLECFRSRDPEIQESLHRLELKYSSNPAFLPWAGHLEIVGRKQADR